MKKLLSILVSAIFLITCLQAQDDDENVKELIVPQIVKNAFKAKFQQLPVKSWGMENKDYEATFIQSNKECTAVFSVEGVWKETEYKIDIQDLPMAIRSSLEKTEYRDWKIKESETSLTPQGQTYEIKVKKEEKSKYLKFSSAGKLLETKEEKY